MKPTTIRLPQHTLDALDSEYAEYGHRDRSEYIRYIVDHRAVVLEHTETTDPRSPLTTDDYDRIEKRIDELEKRIDDLKPGAPSSDRDPGPRVPETAIEDLLLEWEPEQEVNEKVARRETRRAVEWLRETSERQTRSEFIDALAANSSLGERSWWERAVQPGLRRLVDADRIEYRAGSHDYKWVG